MGPNFLDCDRDQVLLLPPSLREWLPAGHLAWFVIEAVERLDLTSFYVAYRLDGQGRPAHEPSMMVALLLYSYAVGERSSRRIERRCIEDVATRVICANRVPDHTTIARFRQRHETALAELFGEVLWLCAEAGLVRVGVVAVDGTKVHANASHHATRDYEQIAREILEHADAIDAEEDERLRGGARRRAARGDRDAGRPSAVAARRAPAPGRAPRTGGAADPGPAAQAPEGGQAPPGGRPPGPARCQRRLRGLPPQRAHAQRAAARSAQPAQALRATRGAGGQDQPHRSG